MATQSFLYVAAFIVPTIAGGVLVLMTLVDKEGVLEGRHYVLTAITVTLFPLQGLLNFLVFVRPRYILFRRRAQFSRFQAFWKAAFTLDDTSDAISSSKRHNTKQQGGSGSTNSDNTGNNQQNQTPRVDPPPDPCLTESDPMFSCLSDHIQKKLQHHTQLDEVSGPFK